MNLQNQACSCPAAEHKPLATSCSTGVKAVQTEPSAPAPSHTAPNGPCHASLLSSFSQEGPDKPQHTGVGKKGTGTWQGYLSWQLPCQPSAPGQAAVLMTNRGAPPPAAPALPSTTFPVADSIWSGWCFPFLLPLLALATSHLLDPFPEHHACPGLRCVGGGMPQEHLSRLMVLQPGRYWCPLVHDRVFRGAVTRRGAACGSADRTCPGRSLPKAALLTISFGHLGRRSEWPKWGRFVNLKWTLTQALVLLCLCCGFWHQLTWTCMGETGICNRAGCCAVWRLLVHYLSSEAPVHHGAMVRRFRLNRMKRGARG